MSTAAYLTHVEALATAIAAGRLKPGDRLPPQRVFAFEQGIAVSTASRVYTELLRRGLAVGEIGRGTFVAEPTPSAASVGAEAGDRRVDLEFNFPRVEAQSALIARSLAPFQRADRVDASMRPISLARLRAARSTTAAFLSSRHWSPEPESLLFTGSGRQSLAAAIATLAPIGGRVAVEAVTYPLVKAIAARCGVTLVPIAMDQEGVLPDGIVKAHQAGALSAIYVQPVLHNPLGHSMSRVRREALIETARALGVFVIEDLVYGFLADETPLSALAPDLCLCVDSLSKRVAPGIGLGLLSVPRALWSRASATVRAGAWSAPGMALDIGSALMADGTVAEIQRLKRLDAPVRHKIVADALGGFSWSGDSRSYHVWLRLPDGWRSDAFVAAAAREGIAITASSAFTVVPGHAPNAVRIALGQPDHVTLRGAMEQIARILRVGPDDAELTE